MLRGPAPQPTPMHRATAHRGQRAAGRRAARQRAARETPRDSSTPDEATQSSEPLEDEEPEHGGAPGREPEYVFDTERIVARRQGRDAWPREAAPAA